MIGEVVERAAELAAKGDPSVDAALDAYRQIDAGTPTREGQIWVSVAFLCKRHADMIVRLLR